jgi:uncharacterized protein (TIGR02145 family)
MRYFFSLLTLIGLMFTGTGCDKATTEPSNSLTDPRDGNVYPTITIGSQVWMGENLRYVSSGSWLNPTNPSNTYGRLYSWSAVMSAASTSASNPSGIQGVCPNGWHLPSDIEWSILEIELGLSLSDTSSSGDRGTHGSSMRSITGWSTSGNGTNSSNFNAFPAGIYNAGNFVNVGSNAAFWSSTEDDNFYAFSRIMNSGRAGVNRSPLTDKNFGLSCRCVQD